jgi:flagellar biosynthesis/type III secretory pathway chaperone
MNMERLTELLRDLQNLLRAEYDALRGRDIDELEAVTQRKSAVLTEIETLSGAVTETARPGDDAGWDEIRQILNGCREANLSNGGAIESNRAFVSSLIDVLRGESPRERIYNDSGRLGGVSTSTAMAKV